MPLTLTTPRLIASVACRPSDVGVWLSVNCAFEMLKPPREMFSEPELPRFGGHLKIGPVMRPEVSYVEEKTIQAVQSRVQA